jgi:hypothetical protein
MTALKAYTVHDGGDHSVIVFALHNVVARREGANELDCGFNEVDYCTRSPEFDQYAPGPVPPLVAIEHGWWFECSCCGRKVDSDVCEAAYDDGEDPDLFGAVADGRSVYCSQTCMQREFASRRARRAAEVALIEVFDSEFPGAKITHVYADLEDLRLKPVSQKKSSRYVDGSCISFEFPGGKGGARWKFGDEMVSVNLDDVAAFCAWRGKPVPEQYRRTEAP